MDLSGILQGLRGRSADKEKKGGELSSVLSTLVLAAAIALCVFVLVQVRVYGYVTICGRSLFRVVTGSMEPTIPTGALLVAERTDIDEIETGDIICFRSRDAGTRGWIITHRVIHILRDEDTGEPLLETKGDANSVADAAYASAGNLVGRVVWYSKPGNALAGAVAFLTSATGFMAVVLFPCLLIAGMLLSRSVRNIRQELEILERVEAQGKAQKDKTAAQAAAYGLTPEEYAQMRKEIMRELLAQRDEIMAMVRQELARERQQGEHHEDHTVGPVAQGPGSSGKTEDRMEGGNTSGQGKA